MKSKFLMTAAAFSLSAFGAQAADLAVKARPVPAPAVVGWAGFYVGGVVGYEDNRNGARETDFDFGYYDPSSGDRFSCITNGCFGSNAARLADLIPTHQAFNSHGLGIGVTAGYNFMVSPTILLGIESDLSWWGLKGKASASGSSSDPSCDLEGFGCHFTQATTAVSSGIDWFGTVRGRLGFLATPSTLLFATGGLAYGDVNAGLNVNGSVTWHYATVCCGFVLNTQVPFSSNASTNTIKAGWTVGAGLEQKLDAHWSVKAEYLYYDLGSVSVTNFFTVPNWLDTVGYVTKTDSFKFNGNIVRVGVNYTF